LRTRWFALALAAMFLGGLGGAIIAPQPAGAVSKEIIELQQQVSQILQGQQDLRSAVDTNNATLRTLIQQSFDTVNQLNGQMGNLQKVVQEVQANTGSRIDTMAQQSQGLSDNVQDIQSRVGKVSQQVTEIQSLLQSIDAKVSGNGPAAPAFNGPGPGASNIPGSAPGPGGSSAYAPASGMPPIAADTLYQNALRDFTSGKYDLSRQEFSDYIKNFPANDLASNAQFYLGEIYYSQNDFKDAISAYDNVLSNYPRSFKLAASLYKKGASELELGQKASGTRDLREVVRRFSGSDESRRAQAKLHEIGATTSTARPPATATH
jgi:tol-pal system protein YbgF